jgi:hypothetical protein
MKIVSIAAGDGYVYVLTGDGEIWFFRQGKWEKLPTLN